MFGAILKATNSSFQKGMTFCRSIYVKKVMKLLAFIFEQSSKNTLITVAKTCEKVLRYNKSESRKFSLIVKSHMTKQLLTSISVNMRIFLPLTVMFTSALRSR